MIEYVVGFLTDPFGNVVLIEKNKPLWQAGLLNGVGGKIEKDEVPEAAMEREFEEETGLKIKGWLNYALLTSPEADIYVYKAVTSAEELRRVRSTTDEKVYIHSVYDLPGNVLNNVPWLLAAALYGNESYITAEY